ncbi:MAG: 2-dehydropantoate 2-reductase [Acidobacteria bacterium]|nr:2-dehydropantoate 2-reductase [Acidobacteriota bacterium]MCI0627399.1 2-dehydropantoate 2-reductase [Acidobacteriota bacterium]MCI0720326.1 2-dehydropantoate 2-reductase [Acidobacteriota bacterium]
MRIAIIGAGAMGRLFGGYLASAGNDVTLIDVWREAVESMAANGLRIDDKWGGSQTVRVSAETDPAKVGQVELVLVLVKCMHTEAAIRSAGPLLSSQTMVLTLQNGWGNASRIAAIVGKERLLAGVTYHSSTVLGLGHVHHTEPGATFIGELDGKMSQRLKRIGEVFNRAGIEVTLSENVIKEIWSKLSLCACTLPTSALLGFNSGQLIEHQGTLELMRSLLHEAVAVAKMQGVNLDEEKYWEDMIGSLKRYPGSKASMLQDIEKRRRTEIDVVNGAIVEAGKRLNIPTPYNEVMVWLVKSLEETFES